MKKYIPSVRIALTAAVLALCFAKSQNLISDSNLIAIPAYQIIKLQDSSEELLMEFMQSNADHYAVELKEGSSFPFNLKIQGDFLMINELESPPYQLTIKKTCYMRFVNGLFYFSSDLIEWKEFQDFAQGSIEVGFDPNKQEINVNLNHSEK